MNFKKYFLYTIAMCVVLLIGNIFWVWMWWTKPCECPEVSHVEINWIDSLIPVVDTMVEPIFNEVPPKKYLTVKSNMPFDTSNVVNLYSSCQDTNYYSKDTTVSDSYKATAKVVVTGNELNRFEVNYVSLVPEKITIKEITKTIVEKPKQSLVKVYVGAFGVGSKSYWGIGAKASAIISDRYLIGYGYDFKNNVHGGDLMIKLNWK